ncbi:kelch-like protein 10 [Anoplopoma fimbria]|uniref:kelch-like protein 10 n=1 Tax=Anoplopoma fimbria TaxID=229290 RepID=UPI0023ED6121|nr:kelch-like protein 10 [Anoplopoma fimbria]
MSTVLSNTIFNELRLEGKLCDAVITVGNVEFKVHRIVLCNCSSYFRDLFCRKPSPSEQQQVYNFPQGSPDTMSLIVEFAYTGSVVVTEENVLELLVAADRFAVKAVVRVCFDFLEQQLSPMSCIDVWMLADLHKCPELRQKVYLYILHHFQEVAGFSGNFLQLSAQQLADFIERDELNVRRESVVFEAVLRWIDFAPEERQGDLTKLLSKVRLLLISSTYLVETVSTNALVRKSMACMTLVIDAMKTLQDSKLERPLTRTRRPSTVLLAIGGWEKDTLTNRIELYDVRADRWTKMSVSMEDRRVFHGCVVLNGSVYCIGGYDGGDYLSSVRILDLVTQTWQEARPMHKPRLQVSVVALNGCIYAMGGCDQLGKLRTTERYQPDTGQWTMMAPMHEHRSGNSAATLHGKVYIFGGVNMDEPLSTAECYKPQSNQWTLISPMLSGCNAACSVAYKDKIYVVGGFSVDSHTNRVFIYDPLSNEWSEGNPMVNARSSFGIAVLEDQLYAAGGFDDHGTICKVERYDETTTSWHIVRDMERPRGGFSLCVVEQDIYSAGLSGEEPPCL